MKKEDSLKNNLDELSNKFHHFNYRVVLRLDNTYCICEVWYTRKNKPTFWDKDPTCHTWGSTLKSLKLECKNIMKALKQPILKEVKIKKDVYKLVEVEND